MNSLWKEYRQQRELGKRSGRALMSVLRSTRPGMAVGVLLGRSIAYRLRFEDGTMVFGPNDRGIVRDCTFIYTKVRPEDPLGVWPKEVA